MTLLVFLAIPSFVALCVLAIAHTFQTMNLRLADSAPFPAEAFLQEFFPAAAAVRTAPTAAVRETLLNCTWHSRRLPSSKESNLSRSLHLPVSFLREYRRNRPDSSSRPNLDAKQKPSALVIFPRRRTRLAALTRRPRPLSPALAA